ncbi:MAG: hypothetical protein ACR2LL_10225 [Nitrosopumilus sp.]
MESYSIKLQQHSLLTNQVKKEPVKEVLNLLPNSFTWNELQGLTWTLFEERP